MKTRKYSAPVVKELSAEHDYNRYQSVLLAGYITVIGNKLSV